MSTSPAWRLHGEWGIALLKLSLGIVALFFHPDDGLHCFLSSLDASTFYISSTWWELAFVSTASDISSSERNGFDFRWREVVLMSRGGYLTVESSDIRKASSQRSRGCICIAGSCNCQALNAASCWTGFRLDFLHKPAWDMWARDPWSSSCVGGSLARWTWKPTVFFGLGEPAVVFFKRQSMLGFSSIRSLRHLQFFFSVLMGCSWLPPCKFSALVL